MWARYEAATQRLKHWSTVPFTEPPPAGQVDQEFPDGTVLPTPVFVDARGRFAVRVSTTGLSVDSTALPPPSPIRPTTNEIRAALAGATDIAGLKGVLGQVLDVLF